MKMEITFIKETSQKLSITTNSDIQIPMIKKMTMMNEGDPGPENAHDEDDDWRKRANMKEDLDEVNEEDEDDDDDDWKHLDQLPTHWASKVLLTRLRRWTSLITY